MYIIYNKETTRMVHNLPGSRYQMFEKGFSTERAAKSFLTRMVNKGADRNLFAIADKATFHATIEKQVTKRNIMSGKDFTQPINTPACCDPSTETYWSM